MALRPLERSVDRWIGIGFGLHIAWWHWAKIRRADVIISTVDTCGLPLAMLKYLGLIRAPIIYISQGLAHRADVASQTMGMGWVLLEAYYRFLNSVERVLVLGQGSVAGMTKNLRSPYQKVFSIPFGIDSEFWKPGKPESNGEYLLSVGSDAARDYTTLLLAAKGHRLVIVTRRRLPTSLLGENVSVISDLSNLELRDLYRGAKMVITPLKNVDQPAGQSATLQAMSCAKTVILTNTQGLWEPDHMRHLENCYLVAPYDVEDLRKGIRRLDRQPQELRRISQNARSLVLERYNVRRFAMDLERHILEVLA